MLVLISFIPFLLLLVHALGQPVRRACDQPYHRRRDAYDGIFDLGLCEERGYCWQAAPRNTQIPWCYYPDVLEGHPTVEECAAGAAGTRRDCAPEGGINAASCADEKKCCWAPGEAGQPWCFFAAGQGYAEEELGEDDEM